MNELPGPRFRPRWMAPLWLLDDLAGVGQPQPEAGRLGRKDTARRCSGRILSGMPGPLSEILTRTMGLPPSLTASQATVIRPPGRGLPGRCGGC